MKKAILHSIYGGTIALTAGAAVAIPIVVAKVATKKTMGILEKIVPLNGPNNSLYEKLNDENSDHKGKLNYLALGDMITSGTENGLSFADFLAKDMDKNHILNDYRNFAVAGDRIPEQRARIFRDSAALKALQRADLITVSLGGDDLLAAVEVLKLSFNVLRGESQLDLISSVNTARDALAQSLTMIQARRNTPSAYASNEDAAKLIQESIYKLEQITKSGSLAGVLDIEQELLDNIFDMIKLDLSTFLSEVHAANPGAKIIVLGYPYPFHKLPVSMQNGILPEIEFEKDANGELVWENGHLVTKTTQKLIDGKPANLKDIFSKFVDTLHETVERANYIQFINVNDFEEFKSKIDENTGLDQLDDVMPNALALNPSLYGDQVIGNRIFEWVAQDAHLADQIPYEKNQTNDLSSIYTYVGENGFDEPVQSDTNPMSSMISMLDNQEILTKLNQLLNTIVPDLHVITGDVAEMLLGVIQSPDKLTSLLEDFKTPEGQAKIGEVLVSVMGDEEVKVKINAIKSLTEVMKPENAILFQALFAILNI